MKPDYYTILGVSSNATLDEIRSAYRVLVKEFHPDHYAGGSKIFRKIQEAYSVLSNQEKRSEYDNEQNKATFNDKIEKTRSYTAPEPLIPEKPTIHDLRESFLGPAPVQDFTTSMRKFSRPVRENTDHIFPSSYRQKNNMIVEVKLTTEQIRRGSEIEIIIPRQLICPQCNGEGIIAFFGCARCMGKGVIYREIPVLISIPNNITHDQSVTVSLARIGMPNHFLTMLFHILD